MDLDLLGANSFDVFLDAIQCKSASAGNRARVTLMATMYSATRPLMPDERVMSISHLKDTEIALQRRHGLDPQLEIEAPHLAKVLHTPSETRAHNLRIRNREWFEVSPGRRPIS